MSERVKNSGVHTDNTIHTSLLTRKIVIRSRESSFAEKMVKMINHLSITSTAHSFSNNRKQSRWSVLVSSTKRVLFQSQAHTTSNIITKTAMLTLVLHSEGIQAMTPRSAELVSAMCKQIWMKLSSQSGISPSMNTCDSEQSGKATT